MNLGMLSMIKVLYIHKNICGFQDRTFNTLFLINHYNDNDSNDEDNF